MSAELAYHDNFDALADAADAEMTDLLREPAIDLLTEEAVAQVPTFIKHWMDWRGEDLTAIAREAVEQDDEAIRARVLDLYQTETEQ